MIHNKFTKDELIKANEEHDSYTKSGASLGLPGKVFRRQLFKALNLVEPTDPNKKLCRRCYTDFSRVSEDNPSWRRTYVCLECKRKNIRTLAKSSYVRNRPKKVEYARAKKAREVANRTWLIYRILFTNGKSYIGLTCSLNCRLSAHRKSAKNKENRPLYHAINKYGWSSVVVSILRDKIPTLDEANKWEMEYIQEFNSEAEYKTGYNCTKGGDSNNGSNKTPEQIEAFRQWSVELWKTEGHREYMAEVSKKRKGNLPEWSKEKMSKAAKERIARDGHSWVGRNHREESKEKMKKPKNNTSVKYQTRLIRHGRRIYCSELNFVFFSLKDCAEFFGATKTSMCYSLKNPKTIKYKSLSYYN